MRIIIVTRWINWDRQEYITAGNIGLCEESEEISKSLNR